MDSLSDFERTLILIGECDIYELRDVFALKNRLKQPGLNIMCRYRIRRQLNAVKNAIAATNEVITKVKDD